MACPYSDFLDNIRHFKSSRHLQIDNWIKPSMPIFCDTVIYSWMCWIQQDHSQARLKPVLISKTLWILAVSKSRCKKSYAKFRRIQTIPSVYSSLSFMACSIFIPKNKQILSVLSKCKNLVLNFYTNLLQENLILKNCPAQLWQVLLMLQLHPGFAYELKNSDLLLAKVIRLQIWTLAPHA